MSVYHKAGLVICADDYGLNLHVNAAILELADQNKLEAVSVLVEQLKSQDSEQKNLILKKKSLLLGLHLDLFKGHFFKFIWLCFFNQNEIKKQIEEQLNLFNELFERGPDYVDGHQHCHIYPTARRILIQLLLEKKINLKFIRSVNIHPSVMALAHTPFAQVYLQWLQFLNKEFVTLAHQAKLKTSGFIFGSFADHAKIQSIYKNYLSFSKDQKDLLFCHPSVLKTISADSLSEARVQDYEFFKQLE